jgi:hypothetical protein
MGEVVEETNPVSGGRMLLRTDTQTPTEMYEFGTFRPTEWERVPQAYFIPPELDEVVELVHAHGIKTMMVHQAPSGLEVQAFQVDSLTTSEREYQGRRAQQVWGAYGPPEMAALEPGTVMVPMDQPLARVAFYLLEPRSDDGIVAWGLVGGALSAGMPYPILRVYPEGSSPSPANPVESDG